RLSGGSGLPWQDSVRFAHLAFWMSVGDHAAASKDPTFFDRSALDQIAWFIRNGHPTPGETPKYYKTVFFAPPWPEIYQKDDMRRHEFEDALVEHDDLMDRFVDWGYACCVLPKVSIAERADWVMEQLGLGEEAA
ncbi:MAG: AAA family ATPase, partial [Planctomycetota bacterium]